MAWKFFLEDQPFVGRSNLYIRLDGSHGPASSDNPKFVVNLELKEFQPFDKAEPALTGNYFGDDSAKEFLQAALDAAWDLGLRPSGFADHGRELSAVRDHLHDMRALVYADGSTIAEAAKQPPPLHSEIRTK